MKSPRVHVVAAEVAGRIVRTPDQRLSGLFGAAARNAWTAAREALGTEPPLSHVYLGAMGGFAEEEFLGVSPLNVSSKVAFLQSRLERVRVLPAFTGTSDIGAQVLYEAWRALDASPEPATVLVLAGEQMEPTVEQTAAQSARSAEAEGDAPAGDPGAPTVAGAAAALRAAQRTRRNLNVGRVIATEDRVYGLTMPRAGDLFVDLIARETGLTFEDVRYVLLPHLASAKYRRGRRFVPAQLGDDHPDGLPARDYFRGAMLGRYLSLHDCAPIPSTACALVLTTDAALAARAPTRLVGMGWGSARRPSVPARREPTMQQGAIRDALARCAAASRIGLGALRDADFAVLHDAFPSIEYLFLHGLGLPPDECWRRMLGGWSNPFGGLKVCGHALGASGLLQLVAVHHLMQRAQGRDGGYAREVPPEAGAAGTALFTSLGSTALTAIAGVVAGSDASEAAYLERHGASGDGVPRTEPTGRWRAPEGAAGPLAALPPGDGVVLASLPLRFSREFGDAELFEAARLRPGAPVQLALVDWVRDGGDDAPGGHAQRTFALAEEPLAWGERVQVAESRGRDGVVRHFATTRPRTGAQRATATVGDADPGSAALGVEALIALERDTVARSAMDLGDPVHYFEPERVGDLPLLAYALISDAGRGRVERARVTEPWEGLPRGSIVAVKRLPFDGAQEIRRGREEVLASLAVRAHPNIVSVLYVEPVSAAPAGGAAATTLVVVMEHVWGWHVGDTLGRVTPGLADEDRLRHLPRMTHHGLQALRALRQAGVEHREVNPRNVMVTYDGVLKVLDSAAGSVPPGAHVERLPDGGTWPWVAPERLVAAATGGGYDRARADAWCLGVTLVDFAAKGAFLSDAPELEAELRGLPARGRGWDDAVLPKLQRYLDERLARALGGARAGAAVGGSRAGAALEATRECLARLCDTNPANRGGLETALERLDAAP